MLRAVDDCCDVDDTDTTEDELDQAMAASEPAVVYLDQAQYLLAERFGVDFVGPRNCISVGKPEGRR